MVIPTSGIASGVQLWLWDNANSTWEKAPASVVTKRLTAAGLVVAGKHKLYWVSCNTGAVNSVWELTDAVAALGTVVLSCYSSSRESKMGVLSPPMQFSTGIYCETFTNMTSMVFGYV